MCARVNTVEARDPGTGEARRAKGDRMTSKPLLRVVSESTKGPEEEKQNEDSRLAPSSVSCPNTALARSYEYPGCLPQK